MGPCVTLSETKVNIFDSLHSSAFGYTRLVTRLHSSTFVYIRLSTLVYTRLVTCLRF